MNKCVRMDGLSQTASDRQFGLQHLFKNQKMTPLTLLSVTGFINISMETAGLLKLKAS